MTNKQTNKTDTTKLLKIVDNFKGKRILVIGDVMIDRFIRGSVSRISPEAPVPVIEVKEEKYMPGGAGNLANNLSALGLNTSVVGIIGADQTGTKTIEDFNRLGINAENIIKDESRITTIKTRVIAEHQQVVRFDRETKKPISEESKSKLFSLVRIAIKNCDAILMSDYLKGVLSTEFIYDIIKLAKENNIMLFAGPKPESFSLYTGVNCASLNMKEARTCLHLKDESDVKEIGRNLLLSLKSDLLLITLGEKGMVVFEKKQGKIRSNIIPAVAKEVYDVSGAGDTALATFTAAIVAGADPISATIIANHAAGIVVGKLGTATCSRNELRAALQI